MGRPMNTYMDEKRKIKFVQAGDRTLPSSVEERSANHPAACCSPTFTRRAPINQRMRWRFLVRKLESFSTYGWHWWVIFTTLKGNFNDGRPEAIAALLVTSKYARALHRENQNTPP